MAHTMRAPLPLLVPLAAAALAVTACGGDDTDAGTATGAAAPPSTTAPAPPAGTTTAAASAPGDDAAAAEGTAGRLAAVGRALGSVKSYRFSGTETNEDGEATIRGDIDADGNAILAYDLGKSAFEVRVVSTVAYMKANRAFWRASGGEQGAKGREAEQVASLLAGKWVKMPLAETGVGASLERLAPRSLARCIDVDLGTLRDGGRAKVGDRAATVLIDEGDKPGTTPGRLFVAASGAPLPLRILQTGKRRPGGTVDERCEDAEDQDTSTASDIRLSRFDVPFEVRAPADAIEFPTGGGSEAPRTN